jgi:hypothetical protein
MKKLSVIACCSIALFCSLLSAQQTQSAKPCPPEGFAGGFSRAVPKSSSLTRLSTHSML